MTMYKENILDIVDEWGGFPADIPCSDRPAQNSGVVELKCFINNTCPFHTSPYQEDALVFSKETYDRIQPWLPDDLKNSLMVTPGIPGMHFRPRYVFRNNYIYQKYKISDTEVEGTGVFESLANENGEGELFSNFDENYREISSLPDRRASGVPGVDKTKYMAEQSWVVQKSIFDSDSDLASESDDDSICYASSKWGYRAQKLSSSEVRDSQKDIDSDLAYDYQKNYYDEFKQSWTTDEKGNPTLKSGETLKINKTLVQMPVQERIRDSQERGVHWRLVKRTPLFKGEDFFIRFYKQANDTVLNVGKRHSTPFSEEFSQYWPLDIHRNDYILVEDTRGRNIDGLLRKRNLAISPQTAEGEDKNSNTFDFQDQAYYIIELGMGDRNDNYFIIITERGNPIFVHFVHGVAAYSSNSGPTVVSKKLSEFEEVTGEQLINADWFDITVRNHLGRLLIQFRGDGIRVPPWIVEKWEWTPEVDSVSGEPFLRDKISSISVPRGNMCIMGGNIRSGFIFGPLQYEGTHISMIYPPRESTAREEDMDLAFKDEVPVKLTAKTMAGAFTSSPFFLPTDGVHEIRYSSSDIFIEDMVNNIVMPNKNMFDQSLFTQDAQFYKDYIEEDIITSRRRASKTYEYGSFFYDETIRDFADLKNCRSSNITVRKYKYLDDPSSKKQAFSILVGMMAGDHVFTDLFWERGSPPNLDTPKVLLENLSPDKYNDEQWYVPACKTPIVTSIRLISHESKSLRWNDGTSVGSGVNGNPDQGVSPYFIDASDHVMSFSDSWSASGFSEIEHTGTINFYLNRGMPVENNVTDALMALQNKFFYIEIWAGYSRLCKDGGYPSATRQEGMYKLFTGVCPGGSIDYQYGKTIMSCKIEDYTSVLKGTRFFNSPWFDGVKDINCIHEIMQMAGFRGRGKYDPGSLIRSLSDGANRRVQDVFFHHFDGRMFKMESYALPSGYNRLDQPAFKFNDGEPYIDAIQKIAKRAGKVFFFDQFGVAHYENFQDIIQSNYLGGVPLISLMNFTTNPELYGGQIVYNKLERTYDVNSIFNHIKMMSNTPDFHLLIKDSLNLSSMENPDSEGFIGFLKTYYNQEPMFGSKEAVMAAIKKYSVSFRPKIKSTFETYGFPLRANDIVSIDGENTRVVKVNHNINAEKNLWWMEVETEKYQIVNASKGVK
jgi:hypothetical protein